MTAKKSIGIFCAGWPLDTQTVNCALSLADAGYDVDLFLWRTITKFAPESLWNDPRIRIHNFDSGSESSASAETRTPLRKFLGRMKSHVWNAGRSAGELVRLALVSDNEILPQSVIAKSLELMGDREYKALIGIEKKGMIWAAMAAGKRNIPFVYYSLELYTWDHPAPWKSLNAMRTKLIEQKYHRKAYATIIQDEERAEHLRKDNRLQMMRTFLVPVSVAGPPKRAKSSYLRDRFSIPATQKIILYFGQMATERYTVKVAEAAAAFPDDWTLVIHGPVFQSQREAMTKLNSGSRTVISQDIVPHEQLTDLISSADVSLVFYTAAIRNDELTALSSQKIAFYMQCGIPMISFDYPGYRRLMDKYQCGAVIREMNELPSAIAKILNNYEEYRENAFRCFEQCYRYEKNFESVLKGIEGL